jgi:two-component system, OmpR family, response regulator
MSKGRVLVIDDDEWVCRLLSVAMNEAGFEVKITENAAEGFYRAVEDQPDCIVCDVDLPDQNGYWVARKIRSHPTKVALVPIVFLSGLDDREHRLEGFQVGGDAYLTKPFRIDEVVAQVDALIQMAARLRQARQTLASVPPTGHAMVGNLAQMSVATVLTLLDLERRSGKLEVSSENRTATFIVHAGNMTDTSIGARHMAPIEAFRIVMGWETGKFAFTPAPSGTSTPSGEMISINAVLMEAARLEDEERAAEPAASDRPSSARMAWRETVLRTNAPPRESVLPPRDSEPPSSIQSVESYMPAPPSEAPISQNQTVVPGAGMGSDLPTAGPHIEPLGAPPLGLPPVPVMPATPLPAAGAPPPVRPPPKIEPPIPPAPRVEVPAPPPTPPSPTFGAPPIPPPPPSSLKPLLPPDGAKRSMTPSPRPAITLPRPPITPTTSGSSPLPPGAMPRPPGPVTRPTKPSMPIPKTAFGAPMRSLSPTKVKAVVPPPPPSRPPPSKEPAKESSDHVESGWSVPPPPEDAAKDGAASGTPNAPAKPDAPRTAPLPPRPQRAGQGGGEG